MKYNKIIFLIGLLWGGLSLCFILFIVRIEPPQLGNVLVGTKPFSAVIDSFTADKVKPFLLLFLPYAVGLDLSIWTIGLIVWLGRYGAWPGEALGKVFNLYPVLAWLIIIIYTILGGVIIVKIPYLINYLIFKLTRKI